MTDFPHNSEQTKPQILYLQNMEIILILHSEVSNNKGVCYMLSSPSTLVELRQPPPFPLTADNKQYIKIYTYYINMYKIKYHKDIIFVRYPSSQWKEKEPLGKL